MPSEVLVYPDGQLTWAGDVAFDTNSSSGFLEPRQGTFSGEASCICFLNEPRTRRGLYEVLHYRIEDYHDDGPPSLQQIIEACRLIEEKLQAGHKVKVWCPDGEKYASHRPFSALCTAAHRILVRGESAADTAEVWKSMNLGFFEHSWAPRSLPAPSRSLSVGLCLKALELARSKNWLEVNTFDVAEWRGRWNEYDLAWVIPKEIEIGGDPVSTILDPDPATAKYLSPEDAGPNSENSKSYTSLFQADGVTLLVRLNFTCEPGLAKSYDPAVFSKYGIDHLHVGYDDVNGGVPSNGCVKKVIDKCCSMPREQAVYFHCKSGFGRSGICAAVLIVFRYDVPGELALAWCRICRPGTITTHQQAEFLRKFNGRADVEALLKRAGDPCCSIA